MRCRRFTAREARMIRGEVRVPAKVPDVEWLRGLNEEREHADVTRCAIMATARIAARHFRERDDYYVRLRRAMR